MLLSINNYLITLDIGMKNIRSTYGVIRMSDDKKVSSSFSLAKWSYSSISLFSRSFPM